MIGFKVEFWSMRFRDRDGGIKDIGWVVDAFTDEGGFRHYRITVPENRGCTVDGVAKVRCITMSVICHDVIKIISLDTQKNMKELQKLLNKQP